MRRPFLIVLLFAAAIYSQLPYTFQSGTIARASEMNADLTFLLNKIDTLNARLASLEKIKFPVGTILATMSMIDTLNGSWVLADGRAATTEYFQVTGNSKIPDLRGQFLRGLNAARADGLEDPDGSSRVPGSYQADTLKKHSHADTTFKYLLQSSNTFTANGTDNDASEPNVHTKGEIQPFGGAETRPRNCAVYWYIRVR
jgi:hypothetical protein